MRVKNQELDPDIQAYKSRTYQTLARERRERKRRKTGLPERRQPKGMDAGGKTVAPPAALPARGSA